MFVKVMSGLNVDQAKFSLTVNLRVESNERTLAVRFVGLNYKILTRSAFMSTRTFNGYTVTCSKVETLDWTEDGDLTAFIAYAN